MKYRHALRAYEMGCEQVADAFIAQYFPGQDWRWLDEVGDVIVVGQFFVDMPTVAAAIDLLPSSFRLVEEWWKAKGNCRPLSLRAFLNSKNSKQ